MISPTQLAADAVVGDTTITLVDSTHFPAAGQVLIGGSRYAYSANDHATGILTLSADVPALPATITASQSSGASVGLAPLVARDGDLCGGAIIATATTVLVNGIPVARLGDRVASHGTGPHASATMVEASTTVLAQGIGVCRLGDAASCGHTVSIASPNVAAGG